MTPTVAILGMHRSGTSCLTGCLQECGLQLGDVVTENWDNLKGNRESLQLRRINDTLLEWNGGDWKNPPESLDWDAALEEVRDRAIAERAQLKVWGFKDPRTLLTLPFWLDALPELKLVGTFRHPSFVVSSLSRRDNMPRSEVERIWLHYNAKLIELVDTFAFPLISFDLPQDRYKEQVVAIACRLGLLENGAGRDLKFFDAALVRHSQPLPDYTVSEECEAVYRRLMTYSTHETGRC